MDIINILSSLNKIGLIAFLVTLGFLIYEIVLLNKTKKSQDKPEVPQFQENGQPLPPTSVIKESGWNKISRNNKIILIALSILLIFFGVLTLIGFLNIGLKPAKSNTLTQKKFPTSTPVITLIPTADIPPIPDDSPLPTEFITSTQTELSDAEFPTPTLYLEDESLTLIPSPTVITELPVTSYINNSLILFSVGGLFLFLSLLF